MKYYIINFPKTVPEIPGMKQLASYDVYSVYSFTDEHGVSMIPEGIHHVELDELEGTEAWKFYGTARGYRKAYSDHEGLEPDADELAKGKRKTKIYTTPEIDLAIVSLMKKVFIARVEDEFNKREDRTREAEIIAQISALKTVSEISILKEELLGTEMPREVARELGLWDEETNSRKGQVDYSHGF